MTNTSEVSADLGTSLYRRADEIRNKRDPSMRTALVVQGGAMRGTYSMAALMAIEECGLGDAFDHVIGSSAGAINGAYLLAQQALLAVGVYLDDISNRDFINFCRPWRIVDIDFLVDEVLSARKKLDVEKLRSSASLLHIVLTDAVSGEPHVVTNRSNINLFDAIRATAAMPLLYGKPVQVGSGMYIDGGLVEGIPLQRAIDLGCSDILVVLTRTLGFRRKKAGSLARLIVPIVFRGLPESVQMRFIEGDHSFNKALDDVEQREYRADGVRITVVAPSEPRLLVGRTTKKRADLLACALMGRNDMRRALGLGPRLDNPFG